MSTPIPHPSLPHFKPTPRSTTTGLTPSAASPPRSVPSPANLHLTYKEAGRSPHRPPLAQNYGASPATTAPKTAFAGRLRTGATATGSTAGSETVTPAPDISGPGPLLDAEGSTRRKIAGMAGALGARWGYVCRKGVQRCAERLGLECLWEAEGGERSVLNVAGEGVLVEVRWLAEAVKGVGLSFPGREVEGVERGGEILRRDLMGWDGEAATGRYVGLERFAANLGRLARMDILGRSGASCFEAVEGVHRALALAAAWDGARVAEGETAAARDMAMLCERLGRPRMHSNGQIGPRLEYWADRRLVRAKGRRGEGTAGPDAVDVDPGLYAIRVDVAASPAGLYPPIRNSTAWFVLADDVPVDDRAGRDTFPPPGLTPAEPEPTYLPAPDTGAMDIDSALHATPNLLPGVRFHAALEPPIVMPWQTAAAVLELMSQPLPPDTLQSATYTSLLISADASAAAAAAKDAHLRSSRTVRSFPADAARPAADHALSLNLFVPARSWARALTDMPFSHPHHLLVILPMLRQWAWLGRLVRRSFGERTRPTTATAAHGKSPEPARRRRRRRQSATAAERRTATPPSDTDSSDPDGGGDDDDEPDEASADDLAVVDAELSWPCLPRVDLAVTIPLGAGRDPVAARFAILPGPRVASADGAGGAASSLREGMARVLEISEDVGVLAVWVRERMGEDRMIKDDPDAMVT